MPAAAPLKDALAKKGGLTLSQLVDYDDRLTDALVDRVCYWTEIRKLRPGFHAIRGVREEDVCRILQQEVVLNKDPVGATHKMLELPGLKKYSQSLKTKDEKEHFYRHLSKYVRIYMPDCPFEVGSTNRYTITTHEASVIARRPIGKGEVIKYLTGVQVAMTKKEEQELDVKQRDFSIVMSSRKKVPSLFLGPARFANHDCNANARLSTTGNTGMQIVAVRNIEVDEEITVTYGDDYFGEDNCECLCATCEVYRRNGWGKKRKRRGNTQLETPAASQTPADTPACSQTPMESPAPVPEEAEPEAEPASTPSSYSLRRKRKFMFDANTHSPIPTPDSAASTPVPVKRQKLEATTGASRSKPSRSSSGSQTSRDLDSPSVWPTPKSQRMQPATKLGPQLSYLSESSNPRSLSPASSLLGNSQAASTLTEATIPSDSDSELSILSTRFEMDDTRGTIVRRKKQRGQAPTRQSARHKSAVPTIEATDPYDSDSASSTSSETTSPTPAPVRRPGDHVHPPAQGSRYIACRNCESIFAQAQTEAGIRAACPRCERHARLYGFAWPKTDREGRADKEERVLDFREVHRFVARVEEKVARQESRSRSSARR